MPVCDVVYVFPCRRFAKPPGITPLRKPCLPNGLQVKPETSRIPGFPGRVGDAADSGAGL